MSLPFGITIPQAVTGVGIALALLIARNYGPKGLEWWFHSRRARRERVREWHRELQADLSEVRSVGYRLQTGRTMDIAEVEELIPTTVEMESRVNPEPIEVKVLVDDEVRARIRVAVGLSYHLAHLPEPDGNADSIAGILHHQYQILEKIGSNTSVTLDEVLEIVGEIEQPDELGLDQEEAEQILGEFEAESRTRVEDAGDMTVDELMGLPWDKVDQVISEDMRRKLIEYTIEQYYEISLLKKPGEAKSALEQSEEELFG